MRVYCRGCNREIKIKEISETEYIEADPHGTNGQYRHPKADCDIIEDF